MERARAWDKAKAREKAEITKIAAEDREKMDPEAEATARAKDKATAAKRVVVEASTENRVRVEAKAEFRYWDLGILTVVLNKVKAESNGLKRAMVGAKEDTKDKTERSRAEVEAEERAAKEEEEAELQDMVQAEVEYW